MNSLLMRQIRKLLPSEFTTRKDLAPFLNAVNKSYNSYDEQSKMVQRAIILSSDELSEANNQLKLEAKNQKKVISKLKKVIDTLKFFEIPENSKSKSLELSGSKLVDFIESQADEIVKQNKQRDKLLSDLEYQNQELSDYAHMVSHDLKSPLRSIDALSLWLKEDYSEALNVDGRNNIDLIRSNVEKMEKLISSILIHATIDKNEIESHEIDMNILLEELLSMMYIPEEISIVINDKLPTILGEKYRLQQLFQNLIGNAIKFNDKDKGIIEIGYEDANCFWNFYVKDNGKGIEKKYYKKIFKTFEKLENDVNSSGIGLSTVKKIIKLYNGFITVESKVGVGTTFHFGIKKP